jgi:CRP/FNR family transcriptional regulator
MSKGRNSTDLFVVMLGLVKAPYSGTFYKEISMSAPDISNAPSTRSDTLRLSSLEAEWKHAGLLWSNLRQVCEVLQITPPAPLDMDILFQHVHFKAGQRVHAIGQVFDTLHVLNSGFMKTKLFNELGNEQVLSFPMRGDILGIDGIHTRRYSSEAIALTDCDLILVPYKQLIRLGRSHLELENIMCGAMSRELAREQAIIAMLRALGAEAMVARFLLSLADRFGAMGYSNRLFNLQMTRQEIGSYLGITNETVSRTLSSLHELGLITMEKRTISINDADRLRTLHCLPSTRLRIQQRRGEKQKRSQISREAAVSPVP